MITPIKTQGHIQGRVDIQIRREGKLIHEQTLPNELMYEFFHTFQDSGYMNLYLSGHPKNDFTTNGNKTSILVPFRTAHDSNNREQIEWCKKIYKETSHNDRMYEFSSSEESSTNYVYTISKSYSITALVPDTIRSIIIGRDNDTGSTVWIPKEQYVHYWKKIDQNSTTVGIEDRQLKPTSVIDLNPGVPVQKGDDIIIIHYLSCFIPKSITPTVFSNVDLGFENLRHTVTIRPTSGFYKALSTGRDVRMWIFAPIDAVYVDGGFDVRHNDCYFAKNQELTARPNGVGSVRTNVTNTVKDSLTANGKHVITTKYHFDTNTVPNGNIEGNQIKALPLALPLLSCVVEFDPPLPKDDSMRLDLEFDVEWGN